MRNAIKEFIEPSKSEKQEMWNRAIFVFDTNVLLNLYRYSAKTRKTLLEIFDFIKDRIWCPYQVAWEFMKDRNEVIIDTQNKYEEFSREIDKFMETVKQQLRVSPKDDEYEKLENMLNEWLENYQKHNLLIKEPSNDQLLEKILELFDGKVGKGFSKEELEEIKSEGKRRYEQQIPPGYLDAKKQKGTEDNNTYGDFIIWKEIIQYAKENKIDVLFITDDQKADWWNIVKGRTMGPRIELRKEFRKETEQEFHIYSMTSFINTYEELHKIVISRDTMEEVVFISFDNIVKEVMKSTERREKEKKTKSEINILIKRLERKKQSQKQLERKYKEKGIEMPFEVEMQYENTAENIRNTKKEIDRMLQSMNVENITELLL